MEQLRLGLIIYRLQCSAFGCPLNTEREMRVRRARFRNPVNNFIMLTFTGLFRVVLGLDNFRTSRKSVNLNRWH